MCEPFGWLRYTVNTNMVLWSGTLWAIHTYPINGQIQALGHTQTMVANHPPTSGRLGGLSTPIRPIPQCRVSLTSELLPNLLTLQPLTHCELHWPSAPRAWPANYHELGPAINGSTHSLVCGTCVLPHHP